MTLLEAFPAIANILERTPDALRGLIALAPPEELEWQPAPDRWSISMVFAHLADVEVHGFLSRFSAIAGEESPFLPSYDQLALFRFGARFDGLAELLKFSEQRTRTLEWLKVLPASVAARRGRHEDLGDVAFAELLHEFAFHDLGHIRQVMELYRSRAFYPAMGVFQNYYRINP
ncbi:MAG TPA: DinB family protein [Bryobacteraceae bacterium]|nr:DinB family protein [Bryobacteraceae bacterium]